MNEVFKALSHPVRRRIIAMLRAGPRASGDIAAQFDMAWPTVTGHLNALKDAGLVETERDGASILITGSVVAFEGHPRLIDYACTKAALHNLTISLSKALAERGIRVNCVAPGPVWTPLIPSTLDRDHVARFGADTRFGRPAQPAEIAPSFVFLAADSGGFYTGEVLAPTGRATSR